MSNTIAYMPLASILNLYGEITFPQYIQSQPGWDFYCDLENKINDIVNSNRRDGVSFAYIEYGIFINELVSQYFRDEGFWKNKEQAFEYFLSVLPNNLIVTDNENNVYPAEFDEDQLNEFIVNMNVLLPVTSHKIDILNTPIYNLQRALAIITDDQYNSHKRTVIDFTNHTPTRYAEPKLYNHAFTVGTILRFVDQNSALYAWLNAQPRDKYYTIRMSELDAELYKLYQWFGIHYVDGTWVDLPEELSRYYEQHKERISKYSPLPITFEHIKGKRWEPFGHVKDSMRSLFEDWLPYF